MKRLVATVAGAALAAFAAACATDTTNTNAVNENRTVTTTTTTTNTNANTNVANANTNARRTYNANITEEEYNRDKERYGREAKEGGETIGQGLKDGWLWVKTKAALAAADELRDSTINVDVDNGVITLRGSVANAAQKTAAEKTANGIEGKKSVKNMLKIDPNAGVVMNSNNSNATNHNATNRNK